MKLFFSFFLVVRLSPVDTVGGSFLQSREASAGGCWLPTPCQQAGSDQHTSHLSQTQLQEVHISYTCLVRYEAQTRGF
jgi:hypothetical protein